MVIELKLPPPHLSSSFEVVTSGECHLILFVRMAVNDGCTNVLSVTLNETTVLLGNSTNFKSNNTCDLIILLSFKNIFVIDICKVNKNMPPFICIKLPRNIFRR